MPLAAGESLGPYEILSPLGAGGMGEVYRARDGKLGREVAIKVLPQELKDHPEKLARFEREARLLASLNHPGIATLHGLEEAGGEPFLVMELVEGETLAERIGHGPVPLREALGLAQQVAEALEAAHDKGVIHRDLKPANIKVDPDGRVKVLDFGLAKALAGDDEPEGDLSQSPTLSHDTTRAGVILGTAAYMSPEQAKGKALDRRSDVFSFGAVLFEMLTGRKAFAGEDVSDVLAAILRSEPEWAALPGDVPPPVARLLRRCLAKDRRNRLRDIGDAGLEIQASLTEPTAEGRPSASVASRRRERTLWAFGGATLAGLAVWGLMRPGPTRPQAVMRFSLSLPPDERLTGRARSNIALSPDGRRLVYTANGEVYLREMDRMEAAPIRGTTTTTRSNPPQTPFFSTDGEWVGYFVRGSLMKVSVRGGAPVTLCEVRAPFGASWGADDSIFIGQGPGGILRVSAAGGTPEVVVPMDSTGSERAHGPQMLPDGKTLLFTVTTTGSWDGSQIVAQSIEGGERRVLLENGADARYLPSGHLVYALADTLMAVAFDPDRLEVTGRPVPVVEGLRRETQTPTAQFSFSASGSAVYIPSRDTAADRTLVWVGRDGSEEVLPAEPRAYTYPRLSPDGRRIALDVRDQENDIWVWDLGRHTFTRVTFHPGNDFFPIWTPDGRRVAFGSDRGELGFDVFWKAADGTGAAEPLVEGPDGTIPQAFSADGALLVYRVNTPEEANNLLMRSVVEDGPSEPLLATEFDEANAELSPDGRWLAYESDASGQAEIYVSPFPDVARTRSTVSTAGGTRPLWARDGSELFYLDADWRLMGVSVRAGATLELGNPEVILDEPYPPFPGAAARHYDVSPDGQRFLMIRETGASGPDTIHVIVNWFEELERLAPTD